MSAIQGQIARHKFPKWVPDAARHYLVHTESGLSIRAVARASDCHPSTVMRQVRRFEGRRDDPLIDSALRALSQHVAACDLERKRTNDMMNIVSAKADFVAPTALTQARIDQEAKRILRRLCEQGAVLAVAREMETSVVVRVTPEGEQVRTAIVEREIAQAMALKDWITCPDPEGRIARYFITNTGRSALRRLTAEDENRASGFVERNTDPDGDAGWDIAAIEGVSRAPHRYQTTESPLVGLARRKDRDGKPFLSRELVAAGERLREDYELVEVGMGGVQSWDSFMTGEVPTPSDGSKGAVEAHLRIKDALAELGPGLGDVVLRCCCFLEGLEQTEKKMGWSARSGKIVLRIALQRLKRHYAETQGRFGPMIG
jgi:DNA-directed RNA polymerase specialized sigma24 family protein